MRPHTFIGILATLATMTTSQTIIPTSSSATFPGCALSCGVLLGAQIACTPPDATTTTQLTYDNCFCQYGSLQTLYSTPDSICTAECSLESDRQLLRTWFIGFCQQVGSGIDPVAATATAAGAATTTNGQATGGITFSAAPTQSSSSDHGPTWFSTHWKWVVMVIVLFIGFIVIAVVGIWLKRRHKRRSQEKVARRSGFPMTESKGDGSKAAGATSDLWGPHQHMAASLGYQYPKGGANAGNIVPDRSAIRDPKLGGKGGDTKVDDLSTEGSIMPWRARSTRPRPSELDTDLRAAEKQRRQDERLRAQEKTRKRDRLVEQGLQGLHRDDIHQKDKE